MYKLMIVEDEDLLRMGLTQYVDWNTTGFEVIGEAGDGQKALEIAKETLPDVILTDIKIPHMSGLELAEKVKKQNPETVVIIMSAFDDFQFAQKAIQIGAMDYILKPIQIDQLKKKMLKVKDRLDQLQAEKTKVIAGKDPEQESREMFTSLLLKHETVESVKERYHELLERRQLRFFCAVYITTKNYPLLSMESDYLALIGMDHEVEKKAEKLYVDFKNKNQDIVLDLLRIGNGERLLAAAAPRQDLLESFQNQVGKCLNEEDSLNIIQGPVRMGLKGMEQSFLSVFKKNESYLENEWREATDPESTQFMEFNLEPLTNAIKSGRGQNVRREVLSLQEKIDGEKNNSYLRLVLIVSNIYYSIARLPEEIGSSLDDLIDRPKKFYQDMIAKQNLTDMMTDIETLSLTISRLFANVSSNRQEEIIHTVKRFIDDNYFREDLSVNDAAQYANISVSYLSMSIRQELGVTFTELLTDRRMEKAKDLLKNTTMKNYEIAGLCGYISPAYFSTVFKSSCGMTPSEYRKSK